MTVSIPMQPADAWREDRDRLVSSRSQGRHRALVCRPDGWNWGWLVVDEVGRVVDGQVHRDLMMIDARRLADEALARLAAEGGAP